MAGGGTPRNGLWLALGFAWKLGYGIAVPLVVLLLVGRFLDTRLGTAPWLLLTGLGLSFVLTNVLMFREAMRVMQQAGEENEKHQTPSAKSQTIPNDQNSNVKKF